MAQNREITPSTNGDNGRLADGRFAKGNVGGPGNPNAAAVATWRKALVDAVTAGDIGQVTGVLVEKAKSGEPWAVRELLDRCLGRPQQKMQLEATGEGTWAVMLAALETAASDGKGNSHE